ncbi:hypothetical protein A2U01_0043093, partial [Trifolium medium]|nr:hypothetical protein [Trifolium medium]
MSVCAWTLSVVKVRSSSPSELAQPLVSEEFPSLEGPRDSMPHYLFCRGRDMDEAADLEFSLENFRVMSGSNLLLESGLPEGCPRPDFFDEIELLAECLVVHFFFERL